MSIDFSSISQKSLAGRLLRAPLKWIPPHTALPILQGKLRGKRWIVGSSNHGCWLGSYESTKQKLFTQVVPAGGVVYDVGAHVGFYTLLAAVVVRGNGRVVAFEPMPDNIKYLRQHLELNHIANVQVVEAAVSNVEGEVWFQTGLNSSMGHIATSGDWKVNSVVLDTFCAAGNAPIPDVIKMDIEGAEYNALQGARSILSTYRPTVLLATHGGDVHTMCCDFLCSLGYRLESVNDKTVQETDEIIAYYRG